MAILSIRKRDGSFEEVPALVGSSGKSAYAYAVENGYTGTEEEFAALLGRLTALEPKTPTSVNLTALAPDENGKGYILETYPDGSTQETELTYVDGKITEIKVGDTVISLVW